MDNNKYRVKWDLERLYSGGSDSKQFRLLLEMVEIMIHKFEDEIKKMSSALITLDIANIKRMLDEATKIRANLSEASSFISCLLAINPKASNASALQGNLSKFVSRFESIMKRIHKMLADINDDRWGHLLTSKELMQFEFILKEWREQGKYYLSEKEEDIISDLMADGYHAWGSLYRSFINSLRVHIEIDGETKELSFGQAFNLRSHPDPRIRQASHAALEKEWNKNQDVFAKILNHTAGYRLQIYKKRGITNILDDPLRKNRMNEESLHRMWSVVEKFKQPFVTYLNIKAKLMGNKEMHSYDFWAPVLKTSKKIPYDKAVDFILEHLSQFGTELEDFARQAIHQDWVDSADTPNKSAAAFCARFPLSGESRICLNFGERITDVLTLAHELGHAFHNHALQKLNPLNTFYPLSIAETASIFFEMVILDAALEGAKSDEEKLFLLDERLKRSVMNFMNIHSRFLFEKRFYEERKEGFIPSIRLTQIMKEAIDEAYAGAFHSASAYSWVWTPHFYITGSPFYNFQYTFGYLFSLSIYEEAKKHGLGYEKVYMNLLRDSGTMSIEDLVKRHLGKDITSEEFWEEGIKLCIRDVEDFNCLASKYL